jgi:GT2 family glycosyltransferase
MDRLPLVSILIVNFNGLEYLKRCLHSIRRYPPLAPYEIIVVDNGSKDGSPEFVKQHFSDVYLILNQENLGFAAANNRAISQGKGDLLFFLNSDTELLPDSIDPLIECLLKNSRVGIVGPTEQFPTGLSYPTICPFPSLYNIFLSHTRLRHRFYTVKKINPYRHYWEMAQTAKKPISVDWLSGASMMIRRQVLDEIGWFDDAYFFYMEETDLCKRARDAGWEILLVPSARLFHHGGVSTKKAPGGLLTLSGVLGELRYFKKHCSFLELILLRELLLFEYSLKALIARNKDPRRWAFREVLTAVLGLRKWTIQTKDRLRNNSR